MIQVIHGHEIDYRVQYRSLMLLLLAMCAASAAAVFMMLFPLESYHHIYPHCPWHALTGTHCPGCGTLRGIAAILQGDLLGMTRNNPLAVVLSPLLLYAGFNLVSESIFGYRLPCIYIPKWQYLLVIVIIGYWIARNFCGLLAPDLV